MVTSQELKEENVLRLIIKFSGPAIAGMLMMSIYNIVDRIFIGHSVGTLGIGGLAVAFPLVMIKGAIAMLIGLGSAALISIRMGEGREEEAEKILGHAFSLLVIFAIAIAVISLIFLAPLMRLFGASENILPYAVSYMRIILIGNVFHVISMGGNNLIRATGSPRTAMVTNLIGGGLNIILDAIFIVGLQQGVAGAAFATILSQAAASCWVLAHFLRGNSVLKIYTSNLKLSLSRSISIFKMGAPPFFRTVMNSLIVIILNNSLLIYGGDVAVSAMGVIFSLHSLLILPLMGLSNGAQPVIGFNYGAHQYERVKQALFYAVVLATAIVSTVYIAIMFSPAFFLRLFTTDPELIEVGSQGLRLFMFMLPVLGFQVIGANYFQATGRSLQSILLNLTRQAIFLIPILLILPRYIGLPGVWSAQPIADVLAFILTAIFVWMEFKNLANKEKKFAYSMHVDQ